MTAEHLFKVKALLLVPKSVSNDDVRRALEALANEMMVDIALGEQSTSLRSAGAVNWYRGRLMRAAALPICCSRYSRW